MKHDMSDILYRMIDAGHGAVMVLLLLLIGRLLLCRRDGLLRVHYVAVAYLLVSCVQMLVLFLLEDDTRISVQTGETFSIWMDAIAALVSIGLLYVLLRNRYLYPRRTLWLVCLLVGMQWLCYLLCALLQFADWTYLLYLPLSGALWCAIGWVIANARPAEQAVWPVVDETRDPFLEQLDAVLMQDRYFCSEDITRDEVCKRMLTNRTTFSQRMSEATQMTFSEYLREMRLREAARLLRETDIPIDQVAFEVGLRSASGFHRNFLLSYGMTPRQYREQAKNRNN